VDVKEVGRDVKGKGEGESGRGTEGRKRGGGRLDLDICPGAPEFLVTPLLL